MNNLTTIVAIVAELGALVSALVPIVIAIKRISSGTKCQLRSEMLRIYYHNHILEKIRQYEYENFVFLYDAYKALGGNSFIDKIYKEVQTWEIVT